MHIKKLYTFQQISICLHFFKAEEVTISQIKKERKPTDFIFDLYF